MDAKGSASSRSYTYSKISDLIPGQQVNVAGVVTSFTPPAKSRGTDFFSNIGVIDESGLPLKCVVFGRDMVHMPPQCDAGDIFCIRRGTVSEFEGKLQLRGTRYSSWLLYQTGSNNPLCSSVNCTITETETKRVQQLRKWNATSNLVQAPLSPVMHPPVVAHPPLYSNAPWASPSPSVPPPGVQRYLGLSLTPLGSLAADRSDVAVCGVVQFYKPPARSKGKGKDYYTSIWLLDQSCPNQAISCTLFCHSEHQLPKNVSVGSIVLLKGLKTSLYQDRMQTRGYEKTIVGIFSNTGPTPTTIGGWYTIPSQEVKAIQSLKKWSQDQSLLLLNTELSQVSLGHCFNSFSRVVAVHDCPQRSFTVLEIFDGTAPKLECEGRDVNSSWITCRDHQLSVNYSTSICEVHLLDWSDPVPVQPGQFVSLSNVHAKTISSEQLLVKLTVKQGEAAIKVLEGDQAKNVEEHIRNFPVPCGPFPVFMEPSCTSNKPLFSIINEGSKQAASVREVLMSPVGSVFVVEGEIVSFAHGPVEELCQIRCSKCKTRYVTPRSNKFQLPANAACIACSAPTNRDHLVRCMYVFVMRLRDETGILDISITGEEGARLFQAVPPGNLYLDASSRDKLLRLLYLLTGGNDPFYPVSTGVDRERPKVKCCVKTFVSIEQKTSFTLMDTVCTVCV